MPQHDCIILTGFMGTGKTTLGRLLAQKLHFLFLDTDVMVEEETGKTVAEIFEKDGEKFFRSCEKKALQKALHEKKVVIATGGGVMVDEDNLKSMKKRGIIIGLSTSPEVIFERLKHIKNRPLLREDQNENRMKKIEELLSDRSPYYAQADQIVDTTNKPAEETVEEILKIL